MEHLISAITLAKNYALPAVDDSDFSDLTNWTSVNEDSKASNLIVFTGGVQMTSPAFSPKIDVSYGNNFALTFDLTLTGTDDTATFRIQVYNGVSLISDQFVLAPEGASTITYNFNAGGYTFDRAFITSTFVLDAVWELSNMSLTSTDSSEFALFNTGDRIISYWDDVAVAIKVYREDNPGATTTLITSGPDLGTMLESQFSNWHRIENPAARINTNILISNFAFCSGNDKNEFRSTLANASFPYWTVFIEENSPYCVLNPDPDDPPIVCDIHFDEPYEILAYPSSPYSLNGGFRVHAVSSHATTENPVKYSTLSPTNFGYYGRATNETGIFNNTDEGYNNYIGVGVHDIYAYDVYNCVAFIRVIMTVDPSFYGTLYRQEFKDIQNLVTSRMDIKQSQYTGTVNDEISDGDAPVTLNKVAGDINNKFQVIRGTNAQISLISTSDLRYIGMFSQNDRKFMPVFQKPVGTEVWRGFVTPSIYSEPYISKPYPVNLNAVDGLDTLSNYTFQDDSGNNFTGRMSLISIIMICLNKLNMNLGVRSSVNKYATGFDTGANDDPLDQTYFNVDSFYDEDGEPLNCDEVLEAILKPFGAEIIQCLGWFNIVEVDNKTQAYNYRTFTKDGVKIVGGNGTFDPIVSIVSPNAGNGILFADQDANLDILPAYGTITINHQLKIRNSLFSRSLDILWQANIYHTTGHISFFDEDIDDKQIVSDGKIITVPRKNKFKGISVIDNDNNFGHYVTISSNTFQFTTQNDSLKISFDYQYLLSQAYTDVDEFDPIVPAKTVDPKWIKLKWTLFLDVGSTTYKYSERIGWNTFTSGFYVQNEILVTQFEREFKSFDRTIELPSFTSEQLVGVRLTFQVDTSYSEDFATLAQLTAIPTGVLPLGVKVKGRISGVFRYFFLRLATGDTIDDGERNYIHDNPGNNPLPTDTDTPQLRVVPDDYADPNNVVIWEEEINEGLIIPVDRFDLKRVIASVLPNKKAPIQSETITLVNDANFKEKLDYPIIAGDHPTSIIQKEIYTNWFSDSDGNPTSGWSRSGFSETTTVQQILMKGLSNQYSIPTWKISGSFLDLVQTNFLSVIKSTTVPADIAVLDSEFSDTDTPSQKWNNYGIGSDWVGNATPKPQVDFISVSQDSKYYVQLNPVEIKSGTRINVDIYLVRINTDTDFPRLDRLVIVLLNSGVVVQKVTAVDGMSYDADFTKSIKFNTIADSDNIGFFIENIDGISGTASYYLDYFILKGLTVIRYFGSNSLSINDRHNNLSAELFQLIPAISSSDPDVDDTGGGSTDPGDGNPGNGGGSYSGDYNNDYSSDFETILT